MVTAIHNGSPNVGDFKPSANPCIHCVMNPLCYRRCKLGGNVQPCVPSQNSTLTRTQGANLNSHVSVHTDAAPLSNDFSVAEAGILHCFPIEGAIESVIHRSTCRNDWPGASYLMI